MLSGGMGQSMSTWLSPVWWGRLRMMALVGFGAVVFTLVVMSSHWSRRVSLTQGKVSDVTIFSPRDIAYQSERDHNEYRLLLKRRMAMVDRIYTVDPVINEQMVDELDALFGQLRLAHQSTLRGRPRTLPFAVPEAIRQDVNQIDLIERVTVRWLGEIIARGIKPPDLSRIQQDIRLKPPQELTPDQSEVAISLLLSVLKPNVTYNDMLTQVAQQREAASVRPLTSQVRRGDLIVMRGEVVSGDDVAILTALGMMGAQVHWIKLLGTVAVVTIFMVLVDRFVYFFVRRIYFQTKYYVLLGLISFIVLGMARLTEEIHWVSRGIEGYFCIPIAVAAMMVGLLITPNLSLMMCVLLGLLISMSYEFNELVFLYLFVSSAVSTFAIYKRYSRSQLMVSGYWVGVCNAGLVVIVGLLTAHYDPLWYLANMLVAFIAGVGSSMVTLASLPYIEGLFGITTQQTLLEFSNLNHPLLHRLLMTAPGTYQHSLMVANLSEAAAEAIHADAVLCRVGAYYHDVGKMKRPLFFSENQVVGDNPHTSLSPRLSKLIVAAHPKDGVELASKYRLPLVIKDFMLQHHGTSVVSFFYNQAMVTEEDVEEVNIEEFRYAGPKPQFKEAGIVMLADSVEAAVKSIEKPTPHKIEAMVDRIFQEKIEDHQLAECPLSLLELDRIKDAFLRVFKGVYHYRVDYKEELEAIREAHDKKKHK
ncbi:HDIG domain-containing protein [bacterium]|nr:HDIG domain-containing protein [bacterium]